MTRMRSPRAMLSLVTALTMAVALVLISGLDTARAQGTASVSIVDFAFDPGTITVAAGTTVTWTNTGVPHTVTATDGSFDSGTLNNGETFSYTFNTPGTYNYFCSIHPNMTASVVVTGGDDGGTDDGADDGADDGDDAATTMPTTGAGPTALHDSTSLMLALAGAAALLIALAMRQRRVV